MHLKLNTSSDMDQDHSQYVADLEKIHLDDANAIEIMMQIACGLQYIHNFRPKKDHIFYEESNQKFIHRDIHSSEKLTEN